MIFYGDCPMLLAAHKAAEKRSRRSRDGASAGLPNSKTLLDIARACPCPAHQAARAEAENRRHDSMQMPLFEGAEAAL